MNILRTVFLTVTAGFLASRSPAQSLTHNMDLAPVAGASLACGSGSTTADYSYLRSFNLPSLGITGPFVIQSIDLAIEGCTLSTQLQARLYFAGLPNTYAGLGPVIAAANVTAAPGTLYELNLPFPTIVVNPSVTPDITVEIVTPDLTALGGRLVLGANGHGQTGPTFFASSTCAINNPVDIATLGLPKAQMVMRVNGPCAGINSGQPKTTQTYILCGDANNVGWSWQIVGQGTSYTYLGTEPGVATGASVSVAYAFSNGLLSACESVRTAVTPLPPCGGSGGPSSSRLDITIDDGPLTSFDLYVNSALVGVGVPVNFNPTIQRVILSGNDCNNNGHDDAIDIAGGNSLDTDGDGIPNECECPADFDGDGFISGLDYIAFVLAFEAGDVRADFDLDGFITGVDFDGYVRAFEVGC